MEKTFQKKAEMHEIEIVKVPIHFLHQKETRKEVLDSFQHDPILCLLCNIIKDIKYQRRENEKIDQKLAKRSAKEIKESGETCYMNSCVDQTLITIQALKELQKQHPEFKIQNIQLGGEFLQLNETKHQNAHFFIIYMHSNENYYIDFAGKNHIVHKKGKYENAQSQHLTSLGIFSIPAEIINEEDNLFSLGEKVLENLSHKIDQANSEEKMKLLDQQKKIESFLFQQGNANHIEKLKKDNTPEQYENYLQTHGKTITLITDKKKKSNEE